MRTKAVGTPPTSTKVSQTETPEVWWIEVKPTRWGWEGIAKSNHDRILGGTFDGWGGMPMWRPTERWAHRAVLRVVRQHVANQAREARAEDETRVYPVTL